MVYRVPDGFIGFLMVGNPKNSGVLVTPKSSICS